MEKNLYIDASRPNETRIVLKSGNTIEEYEFEDKNNLNFKNNIYLATVSRVEPSLQAAFINFGRERHGFLERHKNDAGWLKQAVYTCVRVCVCGARGKYV